MLTARSERLSYEPGQRHDQSRREADCFVPFPQTKKIYLALLTVCTRFVLTLIEADSPPLQHTLPQLYCTVTQI
jgi:hypothetical protein